MKINFENKNLRIVLMAILLVVSCFMVYYFQRILGLGSIFSHFFYIPIIIASIWWKRMGLLVAAFLAAVLIFGPFILREVVLTDQADYIRAVLFIVIAFIVAWFSEQIEKGKVKIEHLNAVLRAIRNVNQLITKEKDRDKLIKSACKNLVENRGYHNSWIVLLDKSGEFVASAEAGLGKDFEPKLKQLKRSDLNKCGKSALKQFDVVVIKDPSSACGDCPLAKSYADRGAMTVQLKYGEEIYGLLSASMDRNFLYEEELSLFKEVASDIAFALYNIEMEKRRKEAEETLRESEHRVRTLFDNVADGILLADIENNKFYFGNKMICQMLGYSMKEIKNLGILDIHPKKDLPYVVKQFEEQAKKRIQLARDIPMKRKDGSIFYADINSSPITLGEKTYLTGIFRDITERKRAEEQLKASLKEKEVLLQEVHHRVKNNMQIISSLFNLQAGHIKDKQAYEIFKSSQNRVRSMALIHERLYQSKDLAKVDFTEYAQSLTGHLFSSYGINPEAIKSKLKIKDVFLDINTAIPCALIINELVSNSLKHGFPGSKKGEIKIIIHPLNKNEIVLIVSDNGVGIPKEVDFKNTETLGLHLVSILVKDQLHGDIKLDRTRGTTFHIRFGRER